VQPSVAPLPFRMVPAICAAFLAALALAGCVTWVAPYDKDGVARINELSKSSLAIYQALLETKVASRGAEFSGKQAKAWADVETQIRVHQVFEQSRAKNDGSIAAANELLGFWEAAKKQYCKAAKKGAPAATSQPASDSEFCGDQAVDDAKAVANLVLTEDRKDLSRILGSMVKAEEAKKLATGESK